MADHTTTTWTLPLDKADFDIWAEVAAEWAALTQAACMEVWPDDC